MNIIKSFSRGIIRGILTWEARMVLKKYKPKIVAVTGSTGKTGTKDAIYEVLSTKYFVRKSDKSYNSELGVPLTILGRSTGWMNPLIWMRTILEGLALIFLKNHYPKWLVLEVGTDRPGDIKRTASWIKPDVVVFTRFAPVPVHVEFFKSPDDVFADKAELVKALDKNGLLVLNADDKKVMTLERETDAEVRTFGIKEGATMTGMHGQFMYEDQRPTGVNFKVQYEGSNVPVTLHGVLGIHSAYHALAALAVGAHAGCNMVKMIEALGKLETPRGRVRIIEGIKDTTIIDDTYNSSPVAAEAALETLREVGVRGKRIAVLGDMLELGKYTVDEHKRIGRLAGEICAVLVCVGPRSAHTAEGALLGGLSEKNIFQFNESREAGKFLETKLELGDVVLIKGSQSMRMERAVKEVMAHPDEAGNLLVRQEEAWESR